MRLLLMIDTIREKQGSIEELCRRHAVRRLELFGSAASGHFDEERSDLDFLVEFDPPNEGTRFDQFFGLKEDLEAVFGRPVDLVTAGAITNPYFLKAIEDSRSTVYAG